MTDLMNRNNIFLDTRVRLLGTLYPIS